VARASVVGLLLLLLLSAGDSSEGGEGEECETCSTPSVVQSLLRGRVSLVALVLGPARMQVY
jgi:hypothetical protein